MSKKCPVSKALPPPRFLDFPYTLFYNKCIKFSFYRGNGGMKKQNIFLILALLLFSAAGITVLFRKTDSPELSVHHPRIAAIMIDPDVIFWNDVWQGVRDTAAEHHIALSEYP